MTSGVRPLRMRGGGRLLDVHPQPVDLPRGRSEVTLQLQLPLPQSENENMSENVRTCQKMSENLISMGL